MSWRQQRPEDNTSQKKEAEKEFGKLAKKLREIIKLEGTDPSRLEATQKAKIETKTEVIQSKLNPFVMIFCVAKIETKNEVVQSKLNPFILFSIIIKRDGFQQLQLLVFRDQI
jgi:hypothetical protein